MPFPPYVTRDPDAANVQIRLTMAAVLGSVQSMS